MSKACPCVYFDNGKCKKFSDEKYTSWCAEGACGDKTPSNADRIRAMSDEDLAHLVRRGVCEEIGATQNHCETNTCADCVLEWLKQPAEEVTDHA